MTVPFRANISAGDLGFGIPISHAMQEASTRFRGIWQQGSLTTALSTNVDELKIHTPENSEPSWL